MSETTLPAGFVDLGTHAIHVAKLRQHTTDVHRFLRHLHIARELEQHAPMTAEAQRLYEQADSRSALDATLMELAAIQFAAADELEAELHRRNGK